MVIIGSISKVRKVVGKAKGKGKRIGFVPTMGALHQGHLSLVEAASKECDFVAVSIFVNPLQFGPAEDYKKYPRNFSKDQKLLKEKGVDLIFYPTPKNMYKSGFSTFIEETSLGTVLCGASRPGHFRGVCTVVAKLFNIIEPDIAYFGSKDYQQARIIKQMAQDLDFAIKIKVLATVREKDGLAMSSRNAYLNKNERKDAVILYQSLKLAKKLIAAGERDCKKIINKLKLNITSKETAKIDYIEIKNAATLKDLAQIKGKVLIALAVYIGKTRLIDNLVINAGR